MSNLLDLMQRLGRDAELAADYQKDPAAVIAAAGLTKEETEALLACDIVALKRLTGIHDVMHMTHTVVKAY